MSVKLIYKDVAVGADEDAEIIATHADAISSLAIVPFGADNPAKYVTLEHNMWCLDGSMSIYDGGAVSFESDILSGNDCGFSDPPTLTAALDNKYSSLGASLDFGLLGISPRVNVFWYDHEASGDTLISGAEFYPDENPYFCSLKAVAYNKVVVEFLATDFPRRRARLDMLTFGRIRIFKRDELKSVGVTQEINLISQELPENVLDWTLCSADAVEYMFQRKQEVEARDSQSLLGVFYIRKSSRTALRNYSISCTDAIGLLDDEPFPDAVYTETTAYDLALAICANNEIEMDAALKNKTVSGILQGKTRRQALQQLCFAIGAVADTSGTRKIRIFAPPLSNPKELPTSRVRLGGKTTRRDAVTAIQLTAHSYSTTAPESGGNGITIGGTTYYDTQTVTVINNPEITASDKPNVITISDATLISPANVAEIAQRVYDYYMRRDTSTVKFRLDGEKIGDYISAPTPWGETVTGNYVRGSITLSGIAVSDADIVGTE